ncbi:MAG: hypothetical protein K0S18_110 [Anaerocolumna sp.]|jgi:hypothetical protein|nr:hypothetical protein [Anaerocolumna sp.]
MKKKRCCYNCIFSKYINGESIITSGYKCYKNPFKPVFIGLTGYCKKADK